MNSFVRLPAPLADCLVLREPQAEDRQLWMELHEDAAVRDFLGAGPTTNDDFGLTSQIEMWSAGKGSVLIVSIGPERRAVGFCAALLSSSPDGARDPQIQVAIHKSFRKCDYAKRALRLLIGALQENSRFSRICGYVDVCNERSHALVRALGMKVLGERTSGQRQETWYAIERLSGA